ncbi:hypothetical protein [Borrelia sp. P9F1]|uniref:hypothetical protein n=1 Tax=Borrelia sp. P9F1 TaxID=3058374 RepID=UPI002647CAFF|nr:hypothetical protein [Borrelia sp. P9F1]WKC58497.1 hypothetical protein QYZ68_04780 [Borrelia sp. P9F1]
MQREVNEFEKSAPDRSFADSYKALQDKIRDIKYQLALLPEDAHGRASLKIQQEIANMYREFSDAHKSEFEKLNDTNKNALLSAAQQARKASQDWFATIQALLASLAGSVSKVLTQDLGKAFAQNTAKGTDAFIASAVDVSKDLVSSLGVWGQMAVAIFDFTVGIFKGIEANAIAEIEKRRD